MPQLPKDFLPYRDVLDKAHEKGLEEVEVELVQIPNKDNGNLAVVKATVTVNGHRYSAVGDASPSEGRGPVQTATIRMAETRAKARAMRDAVNLGRDVEGDVAEEGSSEPVRDNVAALPNTTKGQRPARKSQVDLLKALAEDLRGEDGVTRLEDKIGKPLGQLTIEEADSWIDRLQPDGVKA